ncbi:MAG: 6-phosphofructokinase [Pseudomonadota bacterium]
MPGPNVFYAQSGGVTSVINASACGVIQAVRATDKLGKLYAGKNGILGALREELIDTTYESDETIAALKYTPGGAFGSCRVKLKSPKENVEEYKRLIEVFEAHNIGVFLYNGGGDSQDTANKVSQFSQEMGYPIQCIGIPKTVDNDLPLTDTCPGFGSVAKYIAVSTREAGLDVASMCETSTKVFVLEVMGRHAGWIAASAGLAQDDPHRPPHIILFPEITFNPEAFYTTVQETVERVGYCVVVVSEGIKDENGNYLAESTSKDAFGHQQLGGVGPRIAQMVKERLGYKFHWAVADYLQRAARHIASAVDVEQAYAVGKASVEFALAGKTAIMPIIKRLSDEPYQWTIDEAPLSAVANIERKVPRNFISENGFHITDAARRYLSPLIQGEQFPPFINGLPDYARLKYKMVDRKCPVFNKR